MAAATLHVCITCKGQDPFDPEGPRAGLKLYQALTRQAAPVGVAIRPAECLSACDHGCNLALSQPGKWTYVYGRLDPAIHVPAILDGAALYAASGDGIVPWRDRPEIFRKQSLARIPPMEPADE
jgi:predicted metal-binding protein